MFGSRAWRWVLVGGAELWGPKAKAFHGSTRAGDEGSQQSSHLPWAGQRSFPINGKKENSCSRILLEEEIAGAETIIKPQI